jgi:hypothetical protein
MNDNFRWQSDHFGPRVSGLLSVSRLAALGPGTPDRTVLPALRELESTTLFAEPVTDPAAATACLAGLWLYFDYLEESHALSQELSSCEGSFWHAIMHRREPDPANSKYWWRQVGGHPVLDQLRQASPALGYNYTTPFDFVDYCEQHRGHNSDDEEQAQRVQLLEWQLLFAYCHRQACG